MATRSVVTNGRRPKSSVRTAIDAQPLPRSTAQDARQERRLILSDAEVAAQWLNAAKKVKPASYNRVVAILGQLEELRKLRVGLHAYRPGPDPRAWEAALRRLEEQRALVKTGNKGGEVKFPGGRDNTNSPSYTKLYRQTESLHSAVNEALSRYKFRPRVTYFVISDVWYGGMVPDDNSRWFETKFNDRHISEADAVMALVRLDLIGEVTRVRLCESCAARWLAARKSDQHCCSPECRAAFYSKHPDYHIRKATHQRAYRKRLKQAHAAGAKIR